MSPIVYLREDQLSELFKNAGGNEGVYSGVGFEWPGEAVFHVFAKYPPVAPSGRPCSAEFRFLSAPPANDDLPASGDFENYVGKQLLVVQFWQENGGLSKRGVLHGSAESVACDLRFVPARSELYSRSKGLLETDVLDRKHVMIVGLGSFGSLIAVELAKAGVGSFSLYDFDRVELSNISRHVAGISDLGRHKTKVLRDAIWNKNPFAKVVTVEADINEIIPEFEDSCRASDLVICVTDENRSRSNINAIALRTMKPAIFGRAITRAAGGDVFRLRPGVGPCLACIQGLGLYRANEEVSGERQARRDAAAYTSEQHLNATIQVGLASDIAPITNLITKLALVELSRGTVSGISSLEEDLTADFYIWANRRDVLYASWPRMECFFNKNSILRWYGVKTSRSSECIVCNAHEAMRDVAEVPL